MRTNKFVRGFCKFMRMLERRAPVLFMFVIMLSVCLILSGCSFASFAAAAENDIPVVIQMVQNITTIIAPQVSAAIGIAGTAALAALVVACGNPAPGAKYCDPTSLIGQIQAAKDAGVKQTLLEKLQVILESVESHISQMLAIAKGLPVSIGTAIVNAVAIALQTVTLLLGLIPVGLLKLKGGVNTSVVGLKYVPHPQDLRNSFNAAIAAEYPAAAI